MKQETKSPSEQNRKLTPKQQRFKEEYLVDLNATAAAIRAGYSPKTANRIGPRLVGKSCVSEAIAEARRDLSHRTKIDQEWVIGRLKENVDRCFQTIPVLDREGKPSGVYKYEPAAVNRGLELIGKHLGMFQDRLQLEVDVFMQTVLTIMEEVNPEMRMLFFTKLQEKRAALKFR